MTRTMIAAGVVGILMAGYAGAEDLTADQIVEKANQASYYAGADGRSDVKMTISAEGGSNRVREMTILRMNTGVP